MSCIFCVLVICMVARFIHVNIKANKRFEEIKNKTKMVDTSYGKITYLDEGSGEVFLSCHGICGGYDQAYDTLKERVDCYRVLAPSRFGYPGSAVPDEPSVEKQTRAFAELLEQLQIDKVYILGTSAGGATAIKFVLMYPEKTKGLILFCSGYPQIVKPKKKVNYLGPPAMLCHDFPMWLISPLFGPIMGMKQSSIHTMMPLYNRHKGIVLDAKMTNTDMFNNIENYDMINLKVPVLIIHAKDDKMADYKMAELWAKKIPDCTFVSLERGGHLMEGNGERINAELDAFVRRT